MLHRHYRHHLDTDEPEPAGAIVNCGAIVGVV